jgi:polyhydroxybutyrate depolymerase
MDRTAWVHEPPGRAAGPPPVVLCLHGGFGQGGGMALLTHFDEAADRHGFVAVYPDGHRRSWNDGRGNSPAAHDGVDDVGFIAALLDQLAGRVAFDPSRVYATGISNGAMMSQRLGCDLADRIAAIVPVAGSLPERLAARFGPSRPVGVLAVHGTEDRLVPYAGGRVLGRGEGGMVLGAEQSAAMWAQLHACTTVPVLTGLPEVAHDGTTVDRLAYLPAGAPADAVGPVELLRVVGGGHTWPGGRQYLPVRLVGRTTAQFDMAEAMWSFCTRFRIA